MVRSVTPANSGTCKHNFSTPCPKKARVLNVNAVNEVSRDNVKNVCRNVKTSIRVQKPSNWVLKTQNKFEILQDIPPIVSEDCKHAHTLVDNRSFRKKQNVTNAGKGKTNLLPVMKKNWTTQNSDEMTQVPKAKCLKVSQSVHIELT